MEHRCTREPHHCRPVRVRRDECREVRERRLLAVGGKASGYIYLLPCLRDVILDIRERRCDHAWDGGHTVPCLDDFHPDLRDQIICFPVIHKLLYPIVWHGVLRGHTVLWKGQRLADWPAGRQLDRPADRAAGRRR